eukprot:3752237-Rhodomonas_salina.1
MASTLVAYGAASAYAMLSTDLAYGAAAAYAYHAMSVLLHMRYYTSVWRYATRRSALSWRVS